MTTKEASANDNATRAKVIEGRYFHDLMGQPEALQDTLAALEVSEKLRRLTPVAGKYRRVVLTGMGASLNALQPLYLSLLACGTSALLVETSELIHFLPRLLDESTLVVAVSQSGKSAETVRLLDLPQRKSAVIGVTNVADSPLAARADACLVTRAGSEYSVSCKTYISAIAVLAWLGGLLCAGQPGSEISELSQGPGLVREYLSRWPSHVDRLMRELQGVRDLFFLGRGTSMAAAMNSGLIIKESTRFHSEGMSSAAFRHGPFELVGPKVFALVYGGDAKVEQLNRKLVEDIRQAGGRAFVCGPKAELEPMRLPAASPALQPILEILPTQMISLALATLTGVEAGKFRKATKVTEKE
ncbi:MAG TPA: SIS domain-containing protein [Terriglobales bacterium]|nr:SIS domain-containing protein [Terriglobales bacterium]